MTDRANEAASFCEHCHVGTFKPHRATYTRWHDGEFVIVPRVPAWRCDYCGDAFFDKEALYRLVLLLGPESDTEDQQDPRVAGLEGSGKIGMRERRRA
jgi:YgiT-type zinc finger domain-containing protein